MVFILGILGAVVFVDGEQQPKQRQLMNIVEITFNTLVLHQMNQRELKKKGSLKKCFLWLIGE